MHITLSICISAILLTCCAAISSQPDVACAPFGADSYGGWTSTGAAFGSAPSRGPLPGEPMFLNHTDELLANSGHGGDADIGELLSPAFTISRKYMVFTLGGSGYFNQSGVYLLVDGKPVRSEFPSAMRSPNYETIDMRSWDLRDLAGKQAQIRIAGHHSNARVIAGNFVLTDSEPPAVIASASQDITCTGQYLYLGAKIGAAVHRVALHVDGKMVREFLLEAAPGQPDWQASVDISSWRGKKMHIDVDNLPAASKFLANLRQGEKIWTGPSTYHEPLRPVFHITPLYGWNNDVVGPVYYKGEYHVFYEYSPYAPFCDGGKVYWGHVVSRDLAHWTYLEPVLYPDETGSKWSGGSVVDWHNASGLGTASNPPLVLIYTAAKDPFTVGIASSTDGRTFRQYEGNPVLPNINHANRDPHVFWHAPTSRFVMAFYIGTGFPDVPGSPHPGPRERIQLLTSPDLIHWTPTSTVDVAPECPDLYPLALDGDPKNIKWIVSGANQTYKLGQFDGQAFHEETPDLAGYYGEGGSYYASQTFNDLPDGRTIQMGWVRAGAPGMPFTQAISVPMQLRLLSTPQGPRLARWPAAEIEKLHGKTTIRTMFELQPGVNALAGIQDDALDIQLTFKPGEAAAIDLNVRGIPIHYDCKRQSITAGALKEQYAPLRDGQQKMRILVDSTCYEIFAGDGLCYIVLPVVPDLSNHCLSLTATGGTSKVDSIIVAHMKSIW